MSEKKAKEARSAENQPEMIANVNIRLYENGRVEVLGMPTNPEFVLVPFFEGLRVAFNEHLKMAMQKGAQQYGNLVLARQNIIIPPDAGKLH